MSTFRITTANNPSELPDWTPPDLAEEAREMLEMYDGDRALLLVDFDGEIMDVWDAGEPEDNTFARDLAWIPDALERAYALGRKHEAASIANEQARRDAGI